MRSSKNWIQKSLIIAAIFSFETPRSYAAVESTIDGLMAATRNDTTSSSELSTAFQTLARETNLTLRTIRRDIGALLGVPSIINTAEKKVLLSRTAGLETQNKIADIKDSEYAASAFGKQEKIYNLLMAISGKSFFPSDTDIKSLLTPIAGLYGDRRTTAGTTLLFPAAITCKNPNSVNKIGSIGDIATEGNNNNTYLGLLNLILTKIREIPLTKFPKPATSGKNTSSLSVLYAITQVGSRGWNSSLLGLIDSKAGGTINEESAEAILRDETCFIETVFGDPKTPGSKTNGTLLEQWAHLTDADNGILPVLDSGGTIQTKLEEVFEKIHQSLGSLKIDALRNVYANLIPIEPITDTQSEDSIKTIKESDGKSLQEYFSYLQSGLGTDAEAKILPKISACCDAILKLLTPDFCCQQSYEALDKVNKELYRSSLLFKSVSEKFQSASDPDKPLSFSEVGEGISLDVSSEIKSILELQNPVPESKCFSEATVTHLDEITKKLSETNTKLKTFFCLPIGEIDTPDYITSLENNPKAESYCNALKSILCGPNDDNPSKGHSIPFLLKDIQDNLATIQGSLSKSVIEKKSIITKEQASSLKEVFAKIFQDLETDKTALTLDDSFPTNDAGEKVLNICSTLGSDGSASPCTLITPSAISKTLETFPATGKALDELFDKLPQSFDYAKHNPIHRSIFESLKNLKESIDTFFSSDRFETICVQSAIQAWLKDLSATLKTYPDLSGKTYIYDDALFAKFNEFKVSFATSQKSFADLLEKESPPITEPTIDPYVLETSEDTETLWKNITTTLQGIANALSNGKKRMNEQRIPITTIYSYLGSINEDLLNIDNQLSGKKIGKDLTLTIPSTNILNVEIGVSGIRDNFQHSDCCKSLDVPASKLWSILGRLSDRKVSLNHIINDGWSGLIQSTKQATDRFSEDFNFINFLGTTSSAAETFLNSLGESDQPKDQTIQDPSTDQQYCERLIKNTRDMNESLKKMLQNFRGFQESFAPQSYDPASAEKIQNIVHFFQGFESWFKTDFLPSVTTKRDPSLEKIADSEISVDCPAFCSVCNSNIWRIPDCDFDTGGNLTDYLEALGSTWGDLRLTFQEILQTFEKRKCNTYASTLYRYSLQISWLEKNLVTIKDALNTPEALDQFSNTLTQRILAWQASSPSSSSEKLESALNLFLTLFSEKIGGSFQDLPLITTTPGHEQMESVSETLKEAFQFILTTLPNIIPETSQHFNDAVYQGIQFLREMLQEMQTLTSNITGNDALSTECEDCRSLVIKKIKETSFDDFSPALTAFQDSLYHPLCQQKLTYVLYGLRNAIIRFVDDPERIGETPDDGETPGKLDHLLTILQSKDQCKSDTLADALVPLIQTFDPTFVLKPEGIKDYKDGEAESFLNQAFESFSSFPSVLEKIASTTKSGDSIPDWIGRFEKLYIALKKFVELTEANVNPACEHPIHESLKSIFLRLNTKEIWKNFQTHIYEIRKAADTHLYTEDIRGLCENAINLQNKIKKIAEGSNSYKWFNANFSSLSKKLLDLSTGGNTKENPEPFFGRCQTIVKTLNDAITIEVEKQTIPTSDKTDPAIIKQQLGKTAECLAVIRASFSSMREHDSWKGSRQANMPLAKFLEDVSIFVGKLCEEFISYPKESFVFSCEYCGVVDCSDFVTEQNTELTDLKPDFDALSEIAAACFSCRGLVSGVKTLAENIHHIADIVKIIASGREPINPERIQAIMDATEAKIFSPASFIQCTTATESIEKLNDLANAFMDILKKTYLGDSFSGTSLDLTIPNDASCSALLSLTESILQSFSEIGLSVQTISYNSTAPPVSTWEKISNNSLTLSDFVRNVFTCLSKTIKASDICKTCDLEEISSCFSNLINTSFPTINRDIQVLEDNWNAFEFREDIQTHLSTITQFRLLTEAIYQWFADDHELAEILKVNQSWISFIQQLTPTNFDATLAREGANFARSVNYKEGPLLQEISYENLGSLLETLSSISDQNFSIISLIKQNLDQKVQYLDQELVRSYQATATVWEIFSDQFKDLSFLIGERKFTVSNDFYASLYNASREWLTIAEMLKTKELCCQKKFEALKDVVLDFCALEQELSSLSKIKDVTSLENLDLSKTSDTLTELSDFIHETIQEKATCTDPSALVSLSEKLRDFQQALFAIRRTLNSDDSASIILKSPVDFYISDEVSPCDSTHFLLQRISLVFPKIQDSIGTIYDVSIKDLNLNWSQNNIQKVKTIGQTFQTLSENIVPFFHHWTCSFCPQTTYDPFANLSRTSLESINILNVSLYDDVMRRCCNEHAAQSAAITERAYNLMHAIGDTLQKSSLFTELNPDLTQKLFKTGTLLDSNFSVLTDWLSNDPHVSTTSEGIDDLLLNLSNLWNGSLYQNKSIHFKNLLGCEVIDLCWGYINEAFDDLLSSFSSLYSNVISEERIIPSFNEKLSLQKIAVFFDRLSETLKNYSTNCSRCAQEQGLYAASACSEIIKIIKDLCKKEHTCCDSQNQKIEELTQIAFGSEYCVQIINKNSPKKILGDQVLKDIFLRNPLPTQATFEEKFLVIKKILNELAIGYSNSFTPPNFLGIDISPCKNIQNYVLEYKKALTSIRTLLGELAKKYKEKPFLSINSGNEQSLRNVSDYISFLDAFPLPTVCPDCNAAGLIECQIQNCDSFFLKEPIEVIVESLTNKCCLEESKLFHRVFYALMNITSILQKANVQEILNVVNDQGQDPLWESLTDSIQATIADINKPDSTFKAHQNAEENVGKNEEEKSDFFLDRFTQKIEIIAKKLSQCLNISPTPFEILISTPYSCEQKVTDILSINDQIEQLINEFSRLTSELQGTKAEYAHNLFILNAFDAFHTLSLAVQTKIETSETSLCDQCSFLMQKKTAREFFIPALIDLPLSIKSFSTILSKSTCCETKTQKLLTLINHIEKLDNTSLALSDLWRNGDYPTLTGEIELETSLDSIVDSLKGIQKTILENTQNGFENVIERIIGDNRINDLTDSFKDLYRLYTSKEVEDVQTAQNHQDIEPCQRLYFTFTKITDLSQNISKNLENLIQFWQKNSPPYSSVFAQKLTSIEEETIKIQASVRSLLSKKFGHFSVCESCQIPLDTEIIAFEDTLSNQTIASIQDFFSQFRCGNEFNFRKGLLTSLRKLNNSLQHFVNHPIQDQEIPLIVYTKKDDGNLDKKTENITVNITNTTALDPFFKTWIRPLSELIKIIETKQNLFEKIDGSESVKIESIATHINTMTTQLISAYQSLGGKAPEEPNSLVTLSNTCDSNCILQEEIASIFSEICGSLLQGSRWYLKQPYSHNDLIRPMVSVTNRFMTSLDSMLSVPDSPCTLCCLAQQSAYNQIHCFIAQSVTESKLFLRDVSFPKCSKNIAAALDQFSIALKLSADQFASFLPLQNYGNQYEIYKNKLPTTLEKVKDIAQTMQEFHLDFSYLMASLCEKQNDSLACITAEPTSLSPAPTILTQLKALTLNLKDVITPKILELAGILVPGILQSIPANALEMNSMSDHEKIEVIYTRITAYLTQVADNFKQLSQDLKYNVEGDQSSGGTNFFEYSSDSILQLEALGKTLEGIQQQLQKLINSPLVLCHGLSTFKNDLSILQIDASLSENIRSLQDANSVLRDRAWNSIAPGLQNLITKTSSVQDMLSSFFSDDKIEIQPDLFEKLTPSLIEITQTLRLQKELFETKVSEDADFTAKITSYNEILNKYQTDDLVTHLGNLKGALGIYTNTNQSRPTFSKKALFSERCEENLNLMSPYLESMEAELSKIKGSLSVDETGNKSIKDELRNIATKVTELAHQMELFFCAINSAFQKSSSGYPQHLVDQGSKIKGKMEPISAMIQTISSLFETGKCCNGLSLAYHDASEEIYHLTQRIGHLAKNFKIDKFFNSTTHQVLSAIDSLLKDLFSNTYNAEGGSALECYASTIKVFISNPKEPSKDSLVRILANLCPQDLSQEDSGIAPNKGSSSCFILKEERNLFQTRLKDLVSEFQLSIQWIQASGIEPIENFDTIDETIADVLMIQSTLEEIYSSQRSTCESCTENSDKTFLKGLIQSIATLHSNLTALKDVASDFCCPQSIGAVLAKTCSFTEYLAQKTQKLIQQPFNMKVINSEFEQLIQFASACYEPLKSCMAKTLHQTNQASVFEAFGTILDSFKIENSRVYNIMPFDQHSITLYCENIIDSLNMFPSSMMALNEKMRASDYALYPTLLQNIQYFKALLKKTRTLFENPEAAPVLIHSIMDASKTQIAIGQTLKALEEGVNALYETASNSPKEEIIVKQTAKVNQAFKTLVGALNLFQKSITSEVEFGTQAQEVLNVLKSLMQAFPDLTPIADAWEAIKNQEPVESFIDLEQALISPETSLKSITQLTLDLAKLYGNNEDLPLIPETRSDLSFEQLLIEVQHSVSGILDQLVVLSNTVNDGKTRRFHKEIIDLLQGDFSSEIQKWSVSYTSLATAVGTHLPIAYNGLEYAQILNNIASTLYSISEKSQEIAKNLGTKEFSKQAEFMVSLAERVEGLIQGIQAAVPDSTLDQAETFFKQVAQLAPNLVQTVLSSQAVQAHSTEQEQSRPPYLSEIEKLLTATQNAFSVTVTLVAGQDINFDEATLELAKERINVSLETCTETFKTLQTQWLTQPYILRSDLIQACEDITDELKKMTSEPLEKFFEQMTSFVEKLKQPTCCQAVNALTNTIENDLAHFTKDCEQIFQNEIIILKGSSYQNLLSNVTAIANGLYQEDNLDGINTSICHHLDRIQDANCRNDLYLDSLLEVQNQTALIHQKFAEITTLLGVTPAIIPLETTLQDYCQNQTNSLTKIADHFEQIHLFFDHFAETFIPTTGIARPYRLELIQQFSGLVASSIKKFETSLSTFKERLSSNHLCATCDSASTLEALDKVLVNCALISTDTEKMATAFEAFRYSQVSQTMHEVTQAALYLDVLTQEISRFKITTPLSNLRNNIESIHNAFKALTVSWDDLLTNPASSENQLNSVHTLLQSVKTCYQTWIEQLKLIGQRISLPETTQPTLELDEPYTEILVGKDCVLTTEISGRIITNLSALYQKFWEDRFADKSSANLFQDAFIFFQRLLNEKDSLQNMMTGTPSLMIQSFIPDESVLPLLNHFAFLLSHTRCCEDYIAKIESSLSKFEFIQSQIASLISMVPFISPASDEQATLIANFLQDPLPGKVSVFTLLEKLEPTLESLFQLAAKEKDYLCFGVSDQDKNIEKALNSIQSCLDGVSNQFQEISQFFQTIPTDRPIPWETLSNQINTSNIHVDPNIAIAWNTINQKLAQIGARVGMILPALEAKNGLCILNDVDGHLSESLKEFSILSSMATSSSSSLEAYQARCCSVASNQLSEFVHYVAPLKSIQKFDFTLKNMIFSKANLDKISKHLDILSSHAMNLQGLSFHSRAISNVLGKIKQPLLQISNLLSNDIVIANATETPESCESFTQHFSDLNDCLFGESSLLSELQIWGTEISQDNGGLGEKERCYDQEAIITVQRLIGVLSSFSQTFGRLGELSNNPSELCETCSESYPQTQFKNLSKTFHEMGQTLDKINEFIKTPTCCYESHKHLEKMYHELSTIGSVFLSCPISETELIKDEDTAKEIAGHLQETILLLNHEPNTSPLFDSHCCSKQWAKRMNPFVDQYLYPAFSEIKAALMLLGATPAAEPTTLTFTKDTCQNALSITIEIKSIFQKMSEKMNEFKEHVSNFDPDFYSQPFIDTLKTLLQVGEKIRSCLDRPSCFCTGCNRPFSALPGMNIEGVRVDSMQSISKILQDFETSLQIMETRWCRKQSIALHTFVNATEKLSQRFTPLIQAKLDDFKKENAQKISIWLQQMVRTYHQINSTLSSNTLNWHHCSETISFFETLTAPIEAIIPTSQDLLNSLSIPFHDTIQLSPSYDADQILLDWNRLTLVLNDISSQFLTRTFIPRTDHLAIIPEWKELTQSLAPLSTHQENWRTCDCAFCQNLPIPCLGNALLAVYEQQKSFVEQLETVHCCEPMLPVLGALDEPLYQLAQAFQIIQKFAINNLTEEQNTEIATACSAIVPKISSFDSALNAFILLKDLDQDLICSALKIAKNLAVQTLKDEANGLKETILSALVVFDPTLSETLNLAFAQRLKGMTCELLIETIVEDLGGINVSMNRTWEQVNACPVRDIYPVSLDAFKDVKTVLEEFFNHFNPQGLMNPCERYDNYENRQIISKIPAILTEIQTNFGKEYDALQAMCCSRTAYKIDTIFYQIGNIKQILEGINLQGTNAIKTFIENPALQQLANSINPILEATRENWETLLETLMAPSDGYCKVPSIQTDLNNLTDLLNTVISGFNNCSNTSLVPFNSSKIYRCSSIPEILLDGANSIAALNSILKEMNDSIKTEIISYQKVFPFYNLCINLKEALNNLKDFLSTLRNTENSEPVCSHCQEFSLIIPEKLTTELESTPLEINTLMENCHKACDLDIAKLLFQRNEYLAQLAQLPITWRVDDIIGFWSSFVELLDFNAVKEQCESISLRLDAYQKLSAHPNVCQMPLIYNEEKAITEAVYKILQTFSGEANLPEIQDVDSIDNFHNAYVTSYETKNNALNTFYINLQKLFDEIKNLSNKSKQNSFVNTLTVMAGTLSKLAQKERVVYLGWKENFPCPRCSTCTTCTDCTACTDCPICQYSDPSISSTPRTDVRRLVWNTSIQIDNISKVITDLSACIVDNCCSEAFGILFTVPEKIIAIETLFNIFLENCQGGEDFFADSIEKISLKFEPLIEGISELVETRDNQRDLPGNCLLDSLKPPFSIIQSSSSDLLEVLKQTLLDQNLEIPTLQKWSSYNNKCDGVELNTTQLAQSITDLGNDFKLFSQKIRKNKTVNLRAIPIISSWMDATQRMHTSLQNLKIKDGFKPICINCKREKINDGIEAISVAVHELLNGELQIKNAFSHQTCCKDLTTLVLEINGSLSLIGDAIHEISQKPTLEALLETASIDSVTRALGNVAQQIGSITDQREKIEEANDVDPCHIRYLSSGITSLEEILKSQVLDSLPKTIDIKESLSLPLDPSSCSNLNQSIILLGSTWEFINTGITTIYQKIRDNYAGSSDRILIAGVHSLTNNLRAIHDHLSRYLDAMLKGALCLPCQELGSENLKDAVGNLLKESEKSATSLGLLDTFLQDQCCNGIALALESCMNQYGLFVKTFEALSTVQNFGQYLSFDDSLAVFNTLMSTLETKFFYLIRDVLNPFVTTIGEHYQITEISRDVEQSYIDSIISFTNGLKENTDASENFLITLISSPDLNTQSVQPTLDQNQTLVIRKDHHYINDVLRCMDRHNLSLSNSLIHIGDIILLSCERAIPGDATTPYIDFSIRLRNLQILIDELSTLMPTAHMQKYNIENTWKLSKKSWKNLVTSSNQLTSSLQATFCCKNFCVALKLIQQKFERASNNLAAISAAMNAVTTLDADTYKTHMQRFLQQLVALSTRVHEFKEGLEPPREACQEGKFVGIFQTMLSPLVENLVQSTQEMSSDLGIVTAEDKTITPPYSCEKMDFVLCEFGKTISHFNNALMLFTNLAPSLLHQKFNIMLEIVNITDLPSAQYSLENAIKSISCSLEKNCFCNHCDQKKLKRGKTFVFKTISQFGSNLSLIERNMIASDLMVQASVQRQKLYASTTTQQEGRPSPIIKTLFSPVYDERGFPVMDSKGRFVASGNSFLGITDKTKKEALAFGRALLGEKLDHAIHIPYSWFTKTASKTPESNAKI